MKNGGFTLIELVLITGIIFILACIAIPKITSVPQNSIQSVASNEDNNLYILWMLNPANPVGVFQSQP